MRFRDDIRQCVAFIGVGDSLENFVAAGTVFFISHERTRYLVTARHVAEALDDMTFSVRVNSTGETGVQDVRYDPVDHARDFPWLTHEDKSVDLALMEFNIDWKGHNAAVRGIPSDMFLKAASFREENVGVGDICYAVGLFRLMRGKKRNLPFVHTGNIGMIPGDEKIPVKNWRNGPGEPRTIHVEGYLIEMLSLEGLSGSPVFVRPTFDMVGLETESGATIAGRIPEVNIKLLGVWQSAWSGDPDDTLRQEVGDNKVPVGIGAVVPADRIFEILNSPPAAERRKAYLERVEAFKAAKPD